MWPRRTTAGMPGFVTTGASAGMDVHCLLYPSDKCSEAQWSCAGDVYYVAGMSTRPFCILYPVHHSVY